MRVKSRAGNRNSLWEGSKLELAPVAVPSCAEKPLASEEPLSKSLFGPPLESAFDHDDFTGRGGVHSRRGRRPYWVGIWLEWESWRLD